MDKNGWLLHVAVFGLSLDDCTWASKNEPKDVADFVWALLFRQLNAMTPREEIMFREHVEITCAPGEGPGGA